MKRLLVILLLFPVMLFGQTQGAHRISQVLVKGNNIAANVGPYANIRVCVVNTDCKSLATIYSDPSLALPTANPVIADGSGNYNYYIASGCVDEQITTPGQGQIFTPHVCPFNGQAGGGSTGNNQNGPQLRVPFYALSGVQNTLGPTGGTTPGGVTVDAPTQQILSSGQALTFISNPTTQGFQQNPAAPNNPGTSIGNLLNCMQTVAVPNNGVGSQDCGQENILNASATGGINFGNFFAPTGNGGWSVTKVHDAVWNDFTPGIAQFLSAMIKFGKIGDDAGIYMYCFNQGGWTDPSGEGHNCFRANGGNDMTQQFGGTFVSVTKDSTNSYIQTLRVSPQFGFPLVGGYIYDVNDATPCNQGGPCTGGVVGYNGSTTVTFTPGLLTPATGIGTTDADIVNNPSNVNGILHNDITVSIVQGAFVNGPAYMGCSDFQDAVNIENATTLSGGKQTLTIRTYAGHVANCMIGQGGSNGILDLWMDRPQGRSGPPLTWKTSYSFYAVRSDGVTAEVRGYGRGTNFGIITWRHDFGVTTTGQTLTRLGNTVTACGLGNNRVVYGGQMVAVTGGSNASFVGGPFVSSILDVNDCISWTQSGADALSTGANVLVGGAVGAGVTDPTTGIFGSGSATVWPAALVRSVGTQQTTDANGRVQNAFNGTFNLFPNKMNVPQSTTSFIFSLFAPINKTEPVAALGRMDTPPPAINNDWMKSQFSGNGVHTLAFIGLMSRNLNPWCMYKNGAGAPVDVTNCNLSIGQLDPPNLLRLQGPNNRSIWADSPDLMGTVLYISHSPMSTAGYRSFHHIIADENAHGGQGFLLDYDPVGGKSNFITTDNGGLASQMFWTSSSVAFTTNSIGSFTVLTNALSEFDSSTVQFGKIPPGPTDGGHVIFWNKSVEFPFLTTGVPHYCTELQPLGASYQMKFAASSVACQTTVNGLGGAVTLAAGTGISLTPFGQTLTLANTGLTSLNSLTGVATIVGSGAATVGTAGTTITVGVTGFTGKCTSPQTPTFANGVATGCS